MRIVWDLDGVLRDLSGYVARFHKCRYPRTWDTLYNGKTIYECVNANLSLLSVSPATAYVFIVKKHFKEIEIWTSQPLLWRNYTLKWINNVFKNQKTSVYFLTTEEKEDKLRGDKEVILFEDSPNFKDYDRIFLIDRPYNQGVKKCFRVFGPQHLNNLIKMFKEIEND